MSYLGFLYQLLIIFSFDSYGGLGPDLAIYKQFQHTCILDYSASDSERFTELCTGILIDSKTIITAAHCVKEVMPEAIYCGSERKQVSFAAEPVIHSKYDDEIIIESVGYHVYDIAAIQLTEPIITAAVPFMNIEQLNEASACAFFGMSKKLGKNKLEAMQDFTNQSWSVLKQNINTFSDYPFLRVDGLQLPGALAEPGDSGGPLMCLINNQWHFLGVTSSRDYDYRSQFMPSFLVKELGLSGSSAVDSPLLTKENKMWSLVPQELGQLIEQWDKIKSKITETKQTLEVDSMFARFLDQFQLIKQNQVEQYENEKQIIKAAILDILIKESTYLRIKPYSILYSKENKSVGDLRYNYFEVQAIDMDNRRLRGRIKLIGPSENFICGHDILCGSAILENVSVSLSDVSLEVVKTTTSVF